MPLSQDHIDTSTPLGANLVADGCTFRVWAPGAKKVHVVRPPANALKRLDDPTDANLLVKGDGGYWGGFLPGVRDGDQYMFHIVGEGSGGPKRNPYARELTIDPAYPQCNCIVRDPDSFPWHDRDWRTPPFEDFIIYQFHVGTFFGPKRGEANAKFLDVLSRLDYLQQLGVTAIEPLPIDENSPPETAGYAHSDLYSPEMDHQQQAEGLDFYLDLVNELLAARGQPPIGREQLAIPINQLKALIDLCHLSGLCCINGDRPESAVLCSTV